jgi:rhodanese-related sulfurtransferase
MGYRAAMGEPFERVDVARARELVEDGGVLVIDVREPHEWASGHLPGSRHVPLGAFLRDPSSHLEQDNVIFVCAHGMRSQTAAAAAATLGFKKLYSLTGGTVAWAHNGLPLVR